MSPRILTAWGALVLTGCTTFVDSTKDDGTGHGLRYSLPVPFLMITPKPDGTLEPSFVYLPDPDATYTLRTRSIISSYTLDVQLENQMLKSVSLDSKSDAAATALAESASNYAKARLEADKKTEEEAEKADAEAATALAAAELAVLTAQSKHDLLKEAKADPKEILAAKIALEEAIIKRDALKRGQDSSSANLPLAANAPVAGGQGDGPVAAGPMLFRIVPEGKGVKLVAVRGDTVFRTASIAADTNPPRFQTVKGGYHQVRADQSGNLKLELTYNRTITRLSQPSLFKETDLYVELATLKPTAEGISSAPGTKVTVHLDRATPAGRYILSIPLERAGGGSSVEQVNISVVR